MTILNDNIPVGLCSDHAGLDTKRAVMQYLDSRHIPYRDFGTYTPDSCDYPDFAHPCALDNTTTPTCWPCPDDSSPTSRL